MLSQSARHTAALVAVCLSAFLLAGVANCDTLVLDDPLIGGTSGTRTSCQGTFLADGWRVDCQYDSIYWRLPYTIQKGAAEFYVRGLYPNECRAGMEDKAELFHMYDYTWNNPETDYGGYRVNPYKNYIRKIGCLDAPTHDAFELEFRIEDEDDGPNSSVMNWDPNTTYLIREEWEPDGSGSTTFRIKRDGVVVKTTAIKGYYNPVGQGVRIAASGRPASDAGAPIGAVFHGLKVWDRDTDAPAAPEVLYPRTGMTVNATAPVVRWFGDIHSKYEMHITTANDPNTGIVFNSGTVTSSQCFGQTGALANLGTYYVFVRTWSSVGWGAWSAAGQSFTVNTSYQLPNTGIVAISGKSIRDNNGPYLGLGATCMYGMRKCKYYRDRFENDMAYLASRGFKFVRILSMVGWAGKEIAPIDFTRYDGFPVGGWSDYWTQFQACLDIVHKYGMRTEITVFADAQDCMPNELDRTTHMDRIIQYIAGREHKVIMIEVANEHYQNGVPDMATVCAYGNYLAARTTIPVSLSAGDSSDQGIIDMYCSCSADDVATVHFTRDLGTFEGGWLPVRDSWRDIPCCSPLWSNEPIGAGSSVSSETDPIKLVSAAVFAWIAQLPAYVYHSHGGVYGGFHYYDQAGANDYKHLAAILPPDMPSWVRNDGKTSSDRPFTVYCNGVPDKYWTDAGYSGATSGCHRNIGGIKGRQFVSYPQGIRGDGVTLKARREMTFTVYSPMSGAPLAGYQNITKTPSDGPFTLPQGEQAYIIKGTFPDDGVPPSPLVKFAVNPGDGQNVLTWRNPGDVDFSGAKVVFRTDRYPTSVADGTLVCDKVGSANAIDQYTHTGLTNGVRCYYAGFAYDDTPNYSSRSTAIGTPVAGQCFSERFTYLDGDLNGNRSWAGSATATHIQVLSNAVKITGGIDGREAIQPVSCSGSGGIIDAFVNVKLGAGSYTLWGVWFDDPSGKNLARWYGMGTTARGRVGGGSLVTSTQNLTGGWDTLRVRINTVANTSEFFFNGASIGTLSHVETGAGDSIGRVMLDRQYNSTSGDYIYLDNVVIGPAALDATSPGPVTNFIAANAPTQVDLSWTNPADPDYAGTKIMYKTTGYPSDPWDGTLLYDGAGTSCVHANPPGGTIYYAAYAYDGAMNFSSAATASVTRAGGQCYTEAFTYADGNLNGNGDWGGSATSQIVVETQSMKILGGSGSVDAVHTLSCGSIGSQIGVWAKIKKGTGASIFWNLWIDDPNANNFGYWFGTGTSARGRTGAQQTASKTLTTGAWDYLYVKIDFAANTTQFFFNGVSLGSYSHAGTGAGDAIGQIRFERTDSGGASGQYVYFDDIAVSGADATAPAPSVGSPSAAITRTCPVSYTVTFDEPVIGFNSSSDIQVNATGSAAAGSVAVAGSGPYTVTLSSVSGSGTLGITVKASSCLDAAGNANTASAASATFKVLAVDSSVSSIRSLPDDAPVELGDKGLYLAQSGFAYVEDPDRVAGIRLQGALVGSAGDKVCLSGVMKTTAGGERYVLVDAMSACGTQAIQPLGCTNMGLLDPKLTGVYAKCWGRVKPGSITGNSYVLTDGSDDVGIKVITPGIPGVSENEFVTVTGAAGVDGIRTVYKE